VNALVPKPTHDCNVFDNRLAQVARIAANGVQVARLRLAEAMPEPLWDIRERRVLHLAMATPGNVVIETYGKVAAVKAAGNTKQTPNLGNRVTSYEVHRDKS
jgi:hypothetical protein